MSPTKGSLGESVFPVLSKPSSLCAQNTAPLSLTACQVSRKTCVAWPEAHSQPHLGHPLPTSYLPATLHGLMDLL